LQDQPNENYISEIYELKKEFANFRKFTFPVREIIAKLRKYDNGFTKKTNAVFFNDLQEHIDFVLSSLEIYREMIVSLRELNTSNQNNVMNNVMKTLTVISAIFIPLTFIAGIYGMNFNYMPELRYKYGYPLAILAMCVIVILMVIIMKRKKWF